MPSSIGTDEVNFDLGIFQSRMGTTNKGDVIHPVATTNTKATRTVTGESGSNSPICYYEYVEGVENFKKLGKGLAKGLGRGL